MTATADGTDVSKRPDRTVINVLSAGTGALSLLLPIVGVGTAIVAIVMGLLGLRAWRRGEARLGWAAVAGIVAGLAALVVTLWLGASWADTFADFD